MELKPLPPSRFPRLSSLLIELYGIETNIFFLLIFSRFLLLIELYGIETITMLKSSLRMSLLIELYGIETIIKIRITPASRTFNRTIWN